MKKVLAAIILCSAFIFSINADEITFSAAESQVRLKDGMESVVLAGEACVETGSITIRADEINLSGKDWGIIECTGSVSIVDSERNLSIITSLLWYDRINERLLIASYFEIEDRENGMSASANHLEYDMADVEAYDPESFRLKPDQVLHAIKFRRSIRCYKPQKLSREDMELLVQAGRYTATAKNCQGNSFIFVQEELGQLKSMVWEYIENRTAQEGQEVSRDLLPYLSFNKRRKADPTDDYLFRNAPALLFITSERPLDAGLAAQNIETLAVSMDIGVLYNGYLARTANADPALKEWLGIAGETIQACMLLGYPDRRYVRTAPRKEARVIWK